MTTSKSAVKAEYHLAEYHLPAPNTAAGRAIYERAVDLIGDTWSRAYAEEVRIMALAIEKEVRAKVADALRFRYLDGRADVSIESIEDTIRGLES